MSRARFFYGVSAGFGVGWLMLIMLPDGVTPWIVLGAAGALAVALMFHQRYLREARGRRWRRTKG